MARGLQCHLPERASAADQTQEIDMKARMKFGVMLLSVLASGALAMSQQSFANAQDETSAGGDEAGGDEAAVDEAVVDEGVDGSLFLRPPRAKLADLAGSWAISVGGNTGCGLSTLYVTVDLDASGSGSARIISSSTGCPPGDDPAEPFQILSLNPDGSGTAGLSCGPACGWVFTIQVPRSNNNVFTLVDIQDPDNVLVGTAARKW
jgi:hypothetical protein